MSSFYIIREYDNGGQLEFHKRSNSPLLEIVILVYPQKGLNRLTSNRSLAGSMTLPTPASSYIRDRISTIGRLRKQCSDQINDFLDR